MIGVCPAGEMLELLKKWVNNGGLEKKSELPSEVVKYFRNARS